MFAGVIRPTRRPTAVRVQHIEQDPRLHAEEDAEEFYRILQNFVEFCRILQNFVNLKGTKKMYKKNNPQCKTFFKKNFAEFCRILHNFAEFCRILQNFAEFYRILCTKKINYIQYKKLTPSVKLFSRQLQKLTWPKGHGQRSSVFFKIFQDVPRFFKIF